MKKVPQPCRRAHFGSGKHAIRHTSGHVPHYSNADAQYAVWCIKTDLKCIDAQEFPPMPVADFSQGLEINVADLKEMIQQVVFAASTDDARPILTGVLVNLQGDHVTLAAADGFGFLSGKGSSQRPATRSINAVIPARALGELARIAVRW